MQRIGYSAGKLAGA